MEYESYSNINHGSGDNNQEPKKRIGDLVKWYSSHPRVWQQISYFRSTSRLTFMRQKLKSSHDRKVYWEKLVGIKRPAERHTKNALGGKEIAWPTHSLQTPSLFFKWRNQEKKKKEKEEKILKYILY